MITYWLITTVLTMLFYILVGRRIKLKDLGTAVLWGWFIVPMCIFVIVFTQLLDFIVCRMSRRR